MTDELHAHALLRKRKTEDCISEAHGKLMAISLINPNGYPVYLDYHHAELLRKIQREAGELLAKHEKAEKALRAA